jgi:DNA polymerase I-like protein with 3'-5' exonuclease and polymerase domains
LKEIILDVETTTKNNGNPFTQSNKLCLSGLFDGVDYHIHDIEYSPSPYGDHLSSIQDVVNQYGLLIAFNAKFDLHWIRRYGISFKHARLWDCQLVHFIITGQSSPLPSLNQVCDYYGLDRKLDVVASEYWAKGIDTTGVPIGILNDYLRYDLFLTWQVYQKQKEFLKDKPQLKKLCWWACQDLLITEEMEWNGLKYDLEKSRKMGDEVLEEIKAIELQLCNLVPHPSLNWGSPEHLSIILYGGVLRFDVREPYVRTLKSGKLSHKERTVEHTCDFPRLVEPLKGTKLAKSEKKGFDLFGTDEGTLKKLKAKGIAKQIIALMLKRRELSKLVGTYFHGLPNLYEEMEWQNGILHGQLNHCRAQTGRLASNNPNQQNLDKKVRKCITTRFLKLSTTPRQAHP